MAGINRVIIVGRLGADPDVRTTQTAQTVCTLSVATSETWVKDGKKEEKTEWHKVVLWGRLAELAGKYLKKGRLVYVEGRIQTRSWQDKDGQKRYTTEIICTNMQFLEGQSSNDSGRDLGDNAPSLESGSGDPFYQRENTSNGMVNSANSAASLAPMDDIPF